MAVDDAYTVALLHFDDNFTDESGKTWSDAGGATTSTTDPKFGTHCLYLNGTSALLGPNSADLDFGSGDFTIDWWEKPTSTNHFLFSRDQGNGGTYCPYILYEFGLYMSSNGSTWGIASGKSIGTVTQNSWHHYAIVRNGGTFKTYKDGVEQDSWSVVPADTAFYSGVSEFSLGRTRGGYSYFTGYVDEFRISKGIARWTAAFTPPTAAYGPSNTVSASGTVSFSAFTEMFSSGTAVFNAMGSAIGYPVTFDAYNVAEHTRYKYGLVEFNAYATTVVPAAVNFNVTGNPQYLITFTTEPSEQRNAYQAMYYVNEAFYPVAIPVIAGASSTGPCRYGLNDLLIRVYQGGRYVGGNYVPVVSPVAGTGIYVSIYDIPQVFSGSMTLTLNLNGEDRGSITVPYVPAIGGLFG